MHAEDCQLGCMAPTQRPQANLKFNASAAKFSNWLILFQESIHHTLRQETQTKRACMEILQFIF